MFEVFFYIGYFIYILRRIFLWNISLKGFESKRFKIILLYYLNLKYDFMVDIYLKILIVRGYVILKYKWIFLKGIMYNLIKVNVYVY